MEITRETYEPIFVDYINGNLTDDELRDLITFLDDNSDLHEELAELLAFSKQEKVPPVFNSLNKSALKKTCVFSDSESNFDELCIAFYENQLNEKEEQHFLEMVFASKTLSKDFALYGKTYNKPDLSVQYPNKNELKKRPVIAFYRYVSYAASIVILLSFLVLFNKHDFEKVPSANVYLSANHYVESFDLKNQPLLTVQRVQNLKPKTPEKTEILRVAVNERAEVKIPVGPAKEQEEDTFNWEELEELELELQSDLEEEQLELFARKGQLAYNTPSALENYLYKLSAFITTDELEEESVKTEKIGFGTQVSVCRTMEQYSKFMHLDDVIFNSNQKLLLGNLPQR